MNNLVVLPKGSEERNYLAPLDFDLAFERKDFVNIEKGHPNFALQDNKYFDFLMNAQRYQMEMGICGIENMSFLYNTCDFG